jgi:hypothetical protein
VSAISPLLLLLLMYRVAASLIENPHGQLLSSLPHYISHLEREKKRYTSTET